MKRAFTMLLIAAAVVAMGNAVAQDERPVVIYTPFPSPSPTPVPTASPTPKPTPSGEVRKVKARLTKDEEKLFAFPAEDLTVSEAQIEAELKRATVARKSAQDGLDRAQAQLEKAQARAAEAETAVALAEKLLAGWKAAKP